MDYKEQVLRAIPAAYLFKDTHYYADYSLDARPYIVVFKGSAHAPGQLVEADLLSTDPCTMLLLGNWESTAERAWEHAYEHMQRKAIELLSK